MNADHAMSIYDLKAKFQNLLRPICQKLAKRGITANQVTLAALGLSVAIGALIWATHGARWILILVPIVLFVRMGLNALDGMMAREHNMKSKLGAVLNELGDVLSDTAIYLPFAVIPGMPSALLIILVVLAIISEMTGVLMAQLGASRRYDGPMGKSDRAFVFGLLAFLLALGLGVGTWTVWLLLVLNALIIITIVNRVRRGLAGLS